MAIAAIKPYPMPSVAELPSNHAVWEPDAKRCALLVHDMQQYFVEPFTVDASPVNELIANITALRQHCADLAIPVFYTAQPGAQSADERGLLRDFWGAGIGAEREVTRVVSPLMPGEYATVVVKHRYSALHRTRLLEELRDHGRDQLIICGIYAHIGCLATALDAFMNDVQPFMVADAVADFSATDHAMALEYTARCCAVVMSAGQTMQALSRGPQRVPVGVAQATS
jgi:bifunctional isochorismate lyase / aryl carrier protein